MKEWTIFGLTSGQTYKFIVEARNQLFYSDESDAVSILCAMRPQTPLPPTTVNFNANVVINWVAPVENGLPITAYTILIRKKDNTYL